MKSVSSSHREAFQQAGANQEPEGKIEMMRKELKALKV
jgi:hypothetical protein